DAAALLAHIAEGSALAARLLAEARPAWQRPLAVAGIPYGFRQAGGAPGLYRVGDQASVIPSFAGEGVAMALLSGLASGEAIVAGQDAAHFQAAWRRRSAGAMRWAGAGAWLLHHAAPVFTMGAGLVPAAARMLAQRTRLG
ncbi:MAG TPA: hypothetical protein VE684_02845, partial [Crenalkalicoccus sp.]|nr:hypothetical protein [Crenalkalicoccus sp.]